MAAPPPTLTLSFVSVSGEELGTIEASAGERVQAVQQRLGLVSSALTEVLLVVDSRVVDGSGTLADAGVPSGSTITVVRSEEARFRVVASALYMVWGESVEYKRIEELGGLCRSWIAAERGEAVGQLCRAAIAFAEGWGKGTCGHTSTFVAELVNPSSLQCFEDDGRITKDAAVESVVRCMLRARFATDPEIFYDLCGAMFANHVGTPEDPFLEVLPLVMRKATLLAGDGPESQATLADAVLPVLQRLQPEKDVSELAASLTGLFQTDLTVENLGGGTTNDSSEHWAELDDLVDGEHAARAMQEFLEKIGDQRRGAVIYRYTSRCFCCRWYHFVVVLGVQDDPPAATSKTLPTHFVHHLCNAD